MASGAARRGRTPMWWFANTVRETWESPHDRIALLSQIEKADGFARRLCTIAFDPQATYQMFNLIIYPKRNHYPTSIHALVYTKYWLQKMVQLLMGCARDNSPLKMRHPTLRHAVIPSLKNVTNLPIIMLKQFSQAGSQEWGRWCVYYNEGVPTCWFGCTWNSKF